ncbi:MAG: LytR C-terminal domain-containing protein [Ilumatobacteraceae bacterium]
MKHNSKAGMGRGARWSMGAVALLALATAGCSSSSSGGSSSTVTPSTTVSGDPSGSSSTAAGGEPVTVATTAETSPTSSTADPSKAETTTAATTGTAPPTTVATTTTFPLLVQGGVVIVANASGVDGAAAALTKTLADLGFQTVKATNATAYEGKLDTSKVYFSGEGYPAAYSIAQYMGGLVVAAMPTPPPIQNAVEGLRGANVIVMLGGDLAGKQTPGAPEETTTTGPPIT